MEPPFLLSLRSLRAASLCGPGSWNSESRGRGHLHSRDGLRTRKGARSTANASAWNYLRGVTRRRGGGGLEQLESFAVEFVGENDDQIRSSLALELLADIWSTNGKVDKARWAWDKLGTKYDPIRKNYWEYRSGLAQGERKRMSYPMATRLKSRIQNQNQNQIDEPKSTFLSVYTIATYTILCSCAVIQTYR